MTVRRNIAIFALLMLAFILCASIGFEVSWGNKTIDDLEYLMNKHAGISFLDIFYILAVITAVPFVLKSLNRWSALNIFSSKNYQFVLKTQVPKTGFTRILMYSLIEMVIYALFGAAFLFLTDDSEIMGILCIIMVVEQALFLIINRSKFGVAVTEAGIVLLSRQMITIPFNNLKTVEKDFNEFFFVYRNDHNLKIPLVYLGSEDQERLISTLQNQEQTGEVFFSDTLKTPNAS